jgi:hypothetical protein
MKMVGGPDCVKASAFGMFGMLESDGRLVLFKGCEISDFGHFAFTESEIVHIDVAGMRHLSSDYAFFPNGGSSQSL